MELIVLPIVLIALAMLMAVLVAPIALARANTANQRAAGLEPVLRRVERQLSEALDRVAELERERKQFSSQLEAYAKAASTLDAQPAVEQGLEAADTGDAGHGHAGKSASEESTPFAPLGPKAPPALNTLEKPGTVREALQGEMPTADEPVRVEACGPTTPSSSAPWVHDGHDTPTTDAHTAARTLSFEEMLAGKVFVWIGAIALVLTAAFLLKLGFDKNIITPPVRVIGAAVFGVVLWGVGEWARTRVGLISQALCGAAVAVLYASVLAGHELYGLLNAGPAFAMMAVITAAAIVLSLRHGRAVAVLGMVGGFMLPPLLGDPLGGATAGMVLYLLALEVGILAVTGRRGWFGISLLTLLFTVVWSLGYTLIGGGAYQRTLTAMLIVGTAVAYLVQTARLHHDPSASQTTRAQAIGLSIAAVCSAAAVVALLAGLGGFTTRDLWMLGLVAAGTIVLARLDRRYLFIPFVTMGLGLMVLLSGVGEGTATLSATTLGYGALYILGGYLCTWRCDRRRVFALLSVLAGPAYYAVLIAVNQADMGWREMWWPYTLGLGAVYVLGAVPWVMRRRAEHDWPIAAFMLTAFGLVCIAIVQGLSHPRIAVCLALVSAAAALVDRKLFIRPLLVASYVVAAIAAVLLVIPGPFAMDIQGIAVFNTLLPVYALAALGFGLIAWCAGQANEHDPARRMTWLTLGTLGGLLATLTRQAFHPGDFTAQRFELYEWSAYACVLMLGGLLGLLVANRWRNDAVREAAVCIAGIGAVVGFLGGLMLGNPILDPTAEAGWRLVLGLVGLYLLPAWLMALWLRRRALDNLPELQAALRAMSITLVALFAALQVRNGFHFTDLHTPTVGLFECATYALAWMLLGGLVQLLGAMSPDQSITRQAGRIVFTAGLGTALIGSALALNPLWTEQSVGAIPVFNGLWYLFGPAILSLTLLAQYWRRRDRPEYARLAGFLAIGLGFMTISLFVRQGFSGDGVLLLSRDAIAAERYAYSLAWVLFGASLLVAGVFTRLDTLRYGSLAVLLIAVGKVFLIDTASLENLYRVFSFFGLGVTLVGLGYLYQRLVFRRPGFVQKAAQQT